MPDTEEERRKVRELDIVQDTKKGVQLWGKKGAISCFLSSGS